MKKVLSVSYEDLEVWTEMLNIQRELLSETSFTNEVLESIGDFLVAIQNGTQAYAGFDPDCLVRVEKEGDVEDYAQRLSQRILVHTQLNQEHFMVNADDIPASITAKIIKPMRETWTITLDRENALYLLFRKKFAE